VCVWSFIFISAVLHELSTRVFSANQRARGAWRQQRIRKWSAEVRRVFLHSLRVWRRAVNMTDPSKHDITTVLKRLRSLPTNKVSETPRTRPWPDLIQQEHFCDTSHVYIKHMADEVRVFARVTVLIKPTLLVKTSVQMQTWRSGVLANV